MLLCNQSYTQKNLRYIFPIKIIQNIVIKMIGVFFAKWKKHIIQPEAIKYTLRLT
jgi:hypothetical protein